VKLKQIEAIELRQMDWEQRRQLIRKLAEEMRKAADSVEQPQPVEELGKNPVSPRV
jgi:hypothetical protein